MLDKTGKNFCIECRKETEYTLKKKTIKRIEEGEDRTFKITTAICQECGSEMNLPGLIDLNIQEVEVLRRSRKGKA